MIRRKRTYESRAQALPVRYLAPVITPGKSEGETEPARQASLNQDQEDLKIDLLNRLIKHLKTI
ncbi:MAG: hypothetical protein ABSE06_13540 [Anaerolineaceae bacterium]